MTFEDLLFIPLARRLLNFFGASVRWIYGTVWRTIFKKKKFTFQEYLYGPKNSNDSFDTIGHTFNNKIIGGIFIGLLIYVISALIKFFLS